MTLDGLCSDWCMSEEEFIEKIDDMKKYMKEAEFMYVELPTGSKIEEMQDTVSYWESEPLYDGKIDSVVTVYTYLSNSPYGESHSIFVFEMYKTNNKWYIWDFSLELDVSKVNMNNEKYKEAQKTVEGAMDLWIEAMEEKNFDKFISLIPGELSVETGERMDISYNEFLEYLGDVINVKEKKKVTIYNDENISGSIFEEYYKRLDKTAASGDMKLEGIAVYECEVTDYLGDDLGMWSFYFLNLDGIWYIGGEESGELKDDEESREESRQLADNNVCDTIEVCFKVSLTIDEFAYEELRNAETRGILIYFVGDEINFDSQESMPNLTQELQEELEGLKAPKAKGKTSYYISWELDEHRSINNIKVKTITKDEEERILKK